MSVFEEKLISAVFLRPCIYDKNNESHAKQAEVVKAWGEIVLEVGMKKTAAECQKRWRSLRDTFNKNYRERGGKSGAGLDDVTPITWKWYHQLMFLSNFNIPKQTRDNFILVGEPTVEPDELSLPSTSQSTVDGIEFEDEENMENSPVTPVVLPKKRPHVWYDAHAKANPPKRDTAAKWAGVIDKCGKLLDTTNSVGPNSEVDPFASYLSSEMKKMTENEQDFLKFGVMDLIKEIKGNR